MPESIAVTALREATQPLHDAAEERLYAAKIMTGTLSSAEYARVLRSHYLVWGTVEVWLAESSGNEELMASFDLCKRMRAALAEDLLLVASVQPAPLSTDLFTPDDAATLLGVFYVLRGSMLGGTIISRRLKDSPELAALPAHHFYAACATEGPRAWPAFLRRLEDGLMKERELERAVAAARTAFELYLIG